MAAYFTVNTTKLNRPRNYTTSRDVTVLVLTCTFGGAEGIRTPDLLEP